jgi:hypothetical protein
MIRSVVLVLGISAALAVTATPAGGEPPGVKAGPESRPLEIGTPHKLAKTYFDTGNEVGLALPPGSITTVGPRLVVNCSAAEGCTIAGNLNVQLSAGVSENNTALCLVIDGASVSCPYNAIIPPGTGYQVMSYQTFAPVSEGGHTVDMQVVTTTATYLHRWNKQISLYKP